MSVTRIIMLIFFVIMVLSWLLPFLYEVFIKFPIDLWKDRKHQSFRKDLLQWLLLVGFILIFVLVIIFDIRSGGKYSRESRRNTDWLEHRTYKVIRGDY